MKTVYIVRHAKSSWKYLDVKDEDRPLKQRGINDAYLMATALAKNISKPDVFITSSANRALHTAVIFSNVFKYPLANLQINKSLYSFSDGYLIKTIKALDDSFGTAIIFSHDHGISTFVNTFGNTKIDHVSTTGVIGITFDIDHWKNLNSQKSKGKTILIDSPKNHKPKKIN
ncbi:MAG TPA: histidine phosphatase family protein [Flavobacteriia bacterium]|jgi:phosphohistidine phosphatase|nr:histidine phosphatase family protein [Flavobacteriia bacterium]